MTDTANPAPKKKHRTGKILLITVAILIFLGFLGSMGDSASTPSASAPTGADKLELLSYRCYKEYGYFHITGQVKNISDKSIQNVTAVGTTLTEDGQFINSSEALTEYNPILAGQTSPFTVMMTLNPAMSKCQVEFKELVGGTLKTKVAPTE